MRSATNPSGSLRQDRARLRALPPPRALFAAALLATICLPAWAATAEDYLQYRWYRIELVLFEQGTDWTPARPRQLDGMRLPLDAFALVADDALPAIEEPWPVGAAPQQADELPLLISDLPRPLWVLGACASAIVERGAGDPCLPQADLEAYFSDDPTAVWDVDQPSPSATPAEELDPQSAAKAALLAAFAKHEDALRADSYRWRQETPNLARLLPRLRSAYRVVVAGSWQQPVPGREQPQPLLVQAGAADATGRFPLEGWMSVVAGRFVHLAGQLQYRQPSGDIALLTPQRRMASAEDHYIDHPAVGILARVDRLEAPQALLDMVAAYETLASQ